MAEKQTGTLSNGRVMSYAMGDVANNLAFQMTSMFLMVYMTDIVGLSAGVAGTIYAVTKVWAGVADLTAGSTVDKANTRWGRLRPWILWGSTPLAIALVLLFSTPFDARTHPMEAFAWVLLLDAAFQLAYSFVNIPYGSLSAAMTQDSLDRSRLSGARSIASAVTGVALSAIVSPQFQGIQDMPLADVRLKFTITCAILGVLAIALYLVCFLNTREVVPRAPGKVSLGRTLSMVRQNRPLLTLCLGAFFLLGAMFTMNAVAMYYARAILGNAGFFTLLMLAQTVGTILAASLVPTITVRLGKRLGYVAMAAFAVLGYVIAALVPLNGLVVAIIAWFVFGIGSGGTNALMFSMQADTVDYGEWRTGIRSEGGSYSILSFVRKCGQGLGGAVGGAVIGAFGYGAIKAGEAGYDNVITGLRVATGWVPAILGVIAALIIWFYPLTESAHRSLISDLNKRRAEGEGAGEQQAGVAQPAPDVPVVTLFEAYGSGADAIGRLLAERLGVDYTGQRLSSADIEDPATVARTSDQTAASRFLVSVANRGVSDADFGSGADQAADRQLAAENAVEVREAVAAGGVLLGRNATVVLGEMPNALHVRLTAPVAFREQRAVDADGISASVARRRREREDALRVEMSRRLYGWDPSDDSYYDLTINTERYTPEQAADMIVRAYEVKTGRAV